MDLTEFILIFGDGNTGAVKDDEARAGGTGIDSTDETFLQIAMSPLVLQQGTVAVVGLIGVDIDIRFVIVFDDRIRHVGHIKGVSHGDGVGRCVCVWVFFFFFFFSFLFFFP